MQSSIFRFIGFATALALFAGCSRNTPEHVAILDYGLYDATALLSGSPALGQKPTLVSFSILGSREVTNTIPCRPDTYFGLRLAPSTLPTRYHLRLEYDHPPFANADKETRDVSELDVKSKDDFDGEVIWCLLKEFPDEIVPGAWTIRVYIDKKLIAGKEFQLVESTTPH